MWPHGSMGAGILQRVFELNLDRPGGACGRVHAPPPIHPPRRIALPEGDYLPCEAPSQLETPSRRGGMHSCCVACCLSLGSQSSSRGWMVERLVCRPNHFSVWFAAIISTGSIHLTSRAACPSPPACLARGEQVETPPCSPPQAMCCYTGRLHVNQTERRGSTRMVRVEGG